LNHSKLTGASLFYPVLTLLILGIASTQAHADPITSTPPESSAPVAETPAQFTLNGYLDFSYEHLSSSSLLANGGSSRTFDGYENGFRVQQAALNLLFQPKEGVGYVVNLVAGHDATVFAPYPANPSNTRQFDYPQAYLQYATGSLTVIAGRFETLAGYELIDSRGNSNFSRSILYGFAIPFAHTGIRATYNLNDQWVLIGGVVNGWDDLKDTNSSKSLELGIEYLPSKAFTFLAQSYLGRERAGGLVDTGPEGSRQLFDAVATWHLSDALTVVANADYGRQSNTSSVTPKAVNSATWKGVAGYLNYQFSDRFRTSLRLESFDDLDGYRTGIIQAWKEATLTLAYSPIKPLEIRFEARHDLSNASAFIDHLTPSTPTLSLTDHLDSFAIEALVKF
jgi:hypothetical protein